MVVSPYPEYRVNAVPDPLSTANLPNAVHNPCLAQVRSGLTWLIPELARSVSRRFQKTTLPLPVSRWLYQGSEPVDGIARMSFLSSVANQLH